MSRPCCARPGIACLVVCLLSLIAGCADDGKFAVSGSVTYKGQPVPSGEIRFTPDKGNKGPMVLARIKDGKYVTAADKGIVGGAYQLRVSGYGAAGNAKDPSAPDFGRPLFSPYLQDVEFPMQDFEHDINIE